MELQYRLRNARRHRQLSVDGEQYILVASGWGSYAAILMPALLPQLEKVPAASTLIAFMGMTRQRFGLFRSRWRLELEWDLSTDSASS